MNEWGIKTRVLFLTLVPTIIISLLLSAYFSSTRIQDLEKALRDRGYAIALQLAPASEYGVFSGNTHTLQRLANDALSEPEVRSVSIFNKDGRLLVHAGQEHHNPADILSVIDQSNGITMADIGDSLLFTVPVTIRDVIIEDYAYVNSAFEQRENHDNVLGWISIELGRMTTTLRQYQVLFACSIIVLIGLGISGIFAFRMGHDVTRPILQMASAVEKIKNGNLDARVYTNAHSELRHLETGINSMAASLKAAHEEMQQSVEQATADLRQTLETIEIQNIELDMARKEAETASRVKSEFLANMSHEIRTPLNGVIGFINLMAKTRLDTRQHDYISTIQTSAVSLLSIINDILDFSKIEAGKLTIEYAPMDLRECVEEALTLMAPGGAHEKGLELVPMIYSDVPVHIFGDHLRLKQIITNLVNNAIKFTEHGSIVVRIMLEKELADKSMLCVSITDSGIGLSSDEQNTLFQAFTQADSTTTRRFGGTGLGLVISKRIVQQMGGEIGVESEPGKGSTFWFTFQAPKRSDAPITNTHPSLQGRRALILEPHPTTRLSLNHTLTGWGLTVTEVENPTFLNDALLAATQKNEPYDLLIIGINQPDPESHFIDHLTQLAKGTFQCKVAVLANTTDQSIYEEIQATGTSFCLAKPVRSNKLHQALVDTFSEAVNLENNTINDMPLELTLTNSKTRALAVDDNPSNLKLIAALLDDLGIYADCVPNGKAALDHIKSQHYDLVFMDIQMPEMDGIEVTKQIRRLEPSDEHMPIIALTAHALNAEKEAVLRAGMDDYLTKPIDEELLQRIIKRWVHHLPVKHLSASKIPMTTDKPFDWEQSLKLSANKKSLAKEMLEGLLNSLKGAQQEIHVFYAKKDYKALREEVHRLHGACCYCGVPKLKSVVSRMENTIAQKEYNDIDTLMIEFNQAVSELFDYTKEQQYA